MTETKRQVFEELLKAWRYDQSGIIREWGSGTDEEEAGADGSAQLWRDRYERAKEAARGPVDLDVLREAVRCEIADYLPDYPDGGRTVAACTDRVMACVRAAVVRSTR